MEIRLSPLARTVPLMAAAMLALGAPALAIPRAGDVAPPFTLSTADGKSVAESGLKGKPVYLNFFATWCGPCRVETPAIVRMSKKYEKKGLRVVGIDIGESAAKAQGFAKDFSVPYTLAIDPDSTTRASYGGGLYFPLHVFIDAKGVVKVYHAGEMSDGDIEAAITSIMK